MIGQRRVSVGLAVAAVLALTGAGPAWAGEESGLSLGARLGYGFPLGEARAGVSLGDVVSAELPFQLEAAWRFDRSWRLGLWGRYGVSWLAGVFCPAGASCSGQDLGVGVQAAYAFAVPGWSPWVGAGAGLEWQTASVSVGGAKNDLVLFGLEFLDLQAGADWRLSSRLAIGPFASVALGRYRTVTSGGTSESLPAAAHAWLRLGVRGSFDL